MRVPCAVAAVALAGIVFPVPARGSPEDIPAIQEYADPFGPLPTGERPRDFNRLSGDFRVPPSPELLRQLARVDEAERAPLALLVSQVATARERVRAAASADAPSALGASADAPSARQESDGSAVNALADSLFDPGGAGGWLLALGAALAITAAIGAHRIHRG